MENRRIITEGWPTGLVGTIGVTLISSTGTTIAARSTVDISESPAMSGRYLKTVSVDPDNYPIEHIWDDGADYASGLLANQLTKQKVRDGVNGTWTDETGQDFNLTITG